jgi:hypothetical protein
VCGVVCVRDDSDETKSDGGAGKSRGACPPGPACLSANPRSAWFAGLPGRRARAHPPSPQCTVRVSTHVSHTVQAQSVFSSVLLQHLKRGNLDVAHARETHRQCVPHAHTHKHTHTRRAARPGTQRRRTLFAPQRTAHAVPHKGMTLSRRFRVEWMDCGGRQQSRTRCYRPSRPTVLQPAAHRATCRTRAGAWDTEHDAHYGAAALPHTV